MRERKSGVTLVWALNLKEKQGTYTKVNYKNSEIPKERPRNARGEMTGVSRKSRLQMTSSRLQNDVTS